MTALHTVGIQVDERIVPWFSVSPPSPVDPSACQEPCCRVTPPGRPIKVVCERCAHVRPLGVLWVEEYGAAAKAMRIHDSYAHPR